MNDGGPELVACLVARRGRFLVAEPYFEPGLPITLGRRGGTPAEVGELVLVAPAAGGGRGRVVERLGDPEDIDAVLHALAGQAGAARRFPAAVEDAVARLAADPPPPSGDRRDRRGALAFTVDPGTAKDHDDALTVERHGDGLRVLVHIADVAAVVPADGPVDREARRRGFSVYLPGRVDPMLPQALSAGRCSLAPGRPRDVVTVEVTVGADGRVGRPAFSRSQIVSRRRLSYDEVEAILAHGGPCEPDLREALVDADSLARDLRAARARRGALALNRPELELELRGGRVRDARTVAEPRAHALVEELMILANEAVAAELTRRRRPALFRAHEPPDPDSVERLYDALADLGVPTPPLAETLGPTEAAAAVGRVAVTTLEHARRRGHGAEAWSTLILRSLQRARYDAEVRAHAGLASSAYCHFTSPIRRYPDLVVHRALLDGLGGALPPPGDDLDDLAVGLSERERAAATLERDGERICLARLLEDRLPADRDATFDGEVIGLIGSGLFVRFGGVFEGYLPVRRLGRDWYDLNDRGTALVGRSSGFRYRLGDPVAVRVERVESERGRVALALRADDERPQ